MPESGEQLLPFGAIEFPKEKDRVLQEEQEYIIQQLGTISDAIATENIDVMCKVSAQSKQISSEETSDVWNLPAENSTLDTVTGGMYVTISHYIFTGIAGSKIPILSPYSSLVDLKAEYWG